MPLDFKLISPFFGQVLFFAQNIWRSETRI
jgi:hypothetical protein